MAKKLPALPFYVGDWLKDPAVRSVSYAARGLWIDMLCLMHQNDRRGYLQLNDSPVSPDQLARMTGGSAEEVTRLLRELEDSGVFSCTEHGVIYSRRIVRDQRKRDLCSQAGTRGGGNPRLKDQTFIGGSKGTPKRIPEDEEERETTTLSPLPKGGGSGEPRAAVSPSVDHGLTPAGLANLWCFYRKGRVSPSGETLPELREQFEEMLKLGADAQVLHDAITERSGKRDRSEFFWRFKQRFEPRQAASPARSQGESVKQKIARIRKEQREAGNG